MRRMNSSWTRSPRTSAIRPDLDEKPGLRGADRLLKMLRHYAREQHLMVVREFVDVETAKYSGRGGFGEVIAALKADPSCRTILVEKTDRLYRNIKDWMTVDDLGVPIHFVKENAVVSKDSRSFAKAVQGIQALMGNPPNGKRASRPSAANSARSTGRRPRLLPQARGF
jgi:Resolvase, N terminal domain